MVWACEHIKTVTANYNSMNLYLQIKDKCNVSDSDVWNTAQNFQRKN